MRAPRAVAVLLSSAAVLSVANDATIARAQSADHLEVPADTSTLEALREVLEAAAGRAVADGVPRRLTVDTRWPPRSPRAPALALQLREAVERGAGAAASADAEAQLLLDLTADDRELRVALVPREGEPSWWRSLFFPPVQAERWRISLDPELRTFVSSLPRASRSTLSARSVRLPGRGYLAVGSVEVAAGQPPLLVLVRRDGVDLARVAEGRRRLTLTTVATLPRPPAPAPGLLARRAFATLLLEDAGVRIRWRDRAVTYALRLNEAPALEVLTDAQCPGIAHPLPDACAVPVDARDYFASRLVTREGRPAARQAPTSFYTRWRGRVRRTDGSLGDVEIVVTPRGRIVARTGGREVGLAGHGAALGVADVDADGEVEVLVSGAAQGAGEDELTVLRVQADGGLRRLWTGEVRGRVLTAGQGAVDASGVPALLAVAETDEEARLWIVR